jgi:hypothetical protein
VPILGLSRSRVQSRVLRAGTDFGHRPAGPEAMRPMMAHNDNPTRIHAARMVLVGVGRAPPDGSDLLGAMGLRSPRSRNVSCRALADSSAGGTLYPVDRRSWLQTRARIGTGRFMVVGLRQLKLYKILLSAGAPTRAIALSAGAPTRGIAAASVRKAATGSGAAWRIVVHAANRIDFSTVPGASRSCARDSADPLIRPCQAHRRPRPSRASRCGQTVDEKKR